MPKIDDDDEDEFSCYKLKVVFIDKQKQDGFSNKDLWLPCADGTPKTWRIDPAGIPTIYFSVGPFGILGKYSIGLGGHIWEHCLCLTEQYRKKLRDILKGKFGPQGFRFGYNDKHGKDPSRYWGWTLKKVCGPCTYAGYGLISGCRCIDNKEVQLSSDKVLPPLGTKNDITSCSNGYLDSAGYIMLFSNPGDFKSVVKEIDAREDSIPIDCQMEKK